MMLEGRKGRELDYVHAANLAGGTAQMSMSIGTQSQPKQCRSQQGSAKARKHRPNKGRIASDQPAWQQCINCIIVVKRYPFAGYQDRCALMQMPPAGRIAARICRADPGRIFSVNQGTVLESKLPWQPRHVLSHFLTTTSAVQSLYGRHPARPSSSETVHRSFRFTAGSRKPDPGGLPSGANLSA